jgi:nicotinamidase-related amidase
MSDAAPADLTLKPGDALVIVDVQNDFLPGGRLAVSQGDEIVPVLNAWIDAFQSRRLPVFFTRDWHPSNHVSFRESGGIWPVHCVAGTDGAQFSPDLRVPPDAAIVSKATETDTDAYSGFGGTDLNERLRTQDVKRLFVGGLATDYCVLNTVKDAIEHGYEVILLQEGIKAVNVNPDDGARALDEMTRRGAVATVEGAPSP